MKMRRTMSATKEVGERAGLKPQFNCLSLPPSLYWEIITRCGAFPLSHWSNDVVRTSSLLPCSNRTHASSLLHIHIPQARRRTAQNIVENCARRWCKSAVPTQQTRTLPPRPGDHGLLPHALSTCGSPLRLGKHRPLGALSGCPSAILSVSAIDPNSHPLIEAHRQLNLHPGTWKSSVLGYT